MPTWIKRWFQSPVFEDEEKTRVAGMLNVILWAVIATLILRIATIAITNPGGASSVMGINGAVIVLALGMKYLLRAGHVRLVAAASVSILWLVVSVTNFFFGGVRGVGYSSNYLILILAAGLLLSGRASILGATASAALGTVLYYLEINERVTPRRQHPGNRPDVQFRDAQVLYYRLVRLPLSPQLYRGAGAHTP